MTVTALAATTKIVRSNRACDSAAATLRRNSSARRRAIRSS